MRLEQLFLPIMRPERNKVRILFPEKKKKSLKKILTTGTNFASEES